MSEPHRPTITVRVVRMGAEEARADREYWAAMTPEQRLALVWPMTLELWRLKGWDPGEPGLHRSVARVARR